MSAPPAKLRFLTGFDLGNVQVLDKILTFWIQNLGLSQKSHGFFIYSVENMREVGSKRIFDFCQPPPHFGIPKVQLWPRNFMVIGKIHMPREKFFARGLTWQVSGTNRSSSSRSVEIHQHRCVLTKIWLFRPIFP